MKQLNHEIISFLGALFYMLNLGTVQIFYLPFESFSTFFAFLPWGLWIFLRVNKKNHAPLDFSASPRNDWILFFLINLLGTPTFYTQQLFIVYILVLLCFSIPYFIRNYNHSWTAARKLLLSFGLILVVNSFWILPQLYFLKTNGSWVAQAKANQIATEDTLYQNLEKGTLNNFLRLEGFYFDLKGIRNTPLFAPWKDHFNGYYGVLSYLFGGLGILGLLESFRKRKNLGFLFILLLSALALLSATPPFSWVNIWLRQSSFVNQMFRSPFTKFIIPYSLVYSYFVAQGINIILRLAQDHKKMNLFICLFVYLFIFLYSLPSFKGYLISPEMKVKIPSDYFQVMNYLKTVDKNKRVTLLPDYTFWGWFFNRWGYNGSGFLWYGIEQPIISRTFDVWSPKSESYFWEEKQALEAENLTQFEKVLDKYNVDYLILDYSLIPVVSSYKSLATDRIEGLLSQSQKISLVFRGETVALYQVGHPQKIESFVSLSSGLKNIGPQVKLTAEDRAYQENGDYIADFPYDIYYPFADLTTQTRIKDKKWSLEELADSFAINSDIALNFDDYQLYLQSTSEASISDDQGIIDLKLNLNSFSENKKIKINFGKLLVKSFDVSGFNNNLTEFTLVAPELSQKYGYLIKIRSRNIKGSPLFFYIIDETKKQSMLEEKLLNENEYFILPNKFDYGLGYSFVFQNKSYENYPSENLLEEVSVYLFPYKELKDAKFINKNQNILSSNSLSGFEVEKTNYFTYKVSLNNKTPLLNNLILYQTYDAGWIAISNGKILPHVLVNNWANGWLINNETMKQLNNGKILIVFWPQYLEFVGFGLMIVSLIFVLLHQPKIKVDEKNN
ncbi:hypothetical protein COW98_02110 [Candidatus Roizmanbacteria bacterium CG22_combo_CG10-13_8_21_14_all_35_9]|uniref:Membrane protein 6-pyruvoyl-tetrahydropterin synthase-related domain-containing protein n=1 Tax=Candidatus Roizmanbacteria bacterium CG22_combo_CG10-13_8_21_14_all_35_9 TaxID=1974861 RepID=A0A2H0BYL6_9BACT|nr:MAG: hypothetical protein COW98_02110 [Candidatus Roizmanbacteria bacterium CG22_combo_CG10-13_8_21_14_all_35_9]